MKFVHSSVLSEIVVFLFFQFTTQYFLTQIKIQRPKQTFSSYSRKHDLFGLLKVEKFQIENEKINK